MALDDSDRRTMAQLEEDAFTAIKEQPGLRCGAIGDVLFDHVSTAGGSAPFARIAGKVMKRLEKKGLAFFDPKANSRFGGWFPRA